MQQADDFQVRATLFSSRRTVVLRGLLHGEPVVIKRATAERSSALALADLQAELDMLQRLSGNGVVRAQGLFEIDGRPALILEDLDARPLAELLRERRLKVEEALRIAIQCARTLGRIHRAQIIHKDVSPSNILVNEKTGEVILIDFDAASLFSSETTAVQSVGRPSGTLPYISPEQTGRMNRALDYRTDFYSFGAVLHEMLTGEPPFRAADPVEMVHCHIARRPVPPEQVSPAVPAALSDLVMKLLAKTAEERYQSAEGILHDLEVCRAEMERTGTVTRFPLGEKDEREWLVMPQRLYGRDEHIHALRRCFAEASAGESLALVIVGPSGIGKSSLVRELHRPLVEAHGWFIEGKFEQLSRDVPYRAFIQAFRDLINQIVEQGSLGPWPETLTRELGANLGIIAEVIPELSHLVGETPPVPALDARDARHRFHLTFTKFVGLFTRKEHPLVLFIDDLQWADDASLTLLRNLLLDPDSRHLLLVGAYRDSEIGPGHRLREVLSETGRILPLSEIRVAELSVEDITGLLCDTLRVGEARAWELARLLKEKTHGNPFFINQFLQKLSHDQLLRYDTTARRWEWDAAAIQARNITDNVVELLTERLRGLDPHTSDALLLGACMGRDFDIEALAAVSGRAAADVEAALRPALNAGLLQNIASHGAASARRRFAHDRVQQAAYSLIPPSERKPIHLRIGRLLLQNTPVESREERLFEIVEHLDEGRELITDPDERRLVAELNIRAGRRAATSAAFRPAFLFWSAAAELLPSDCWQREYDLTYRLHMDLAEAAYAEGDFPAMVQHVDAVLANARTDVEKVPAYSLQIGRELVGEINYARGLRLGLDGLERAGLPLPEDPAEIEAETGRLMAEVEARLTALSRDGVLNLPPMTDPKPLATMTLLFQIVPSVYVTSPHLFPLVAAKQIALTLEGGLAGISPVSFGLYAVLYAPGAIEDIDTCYRHGSTGLALQQKLGVKRYEALPFFYMGTFLSHWKVHLRESLTLLMKSFDSAQETGNFEYSNYCMEAIHLTVTLRWNSLSDNDELLAQFDGFVRKGTYKFNAQLWRQLGLNLMGRSADRLVLVGEHFNEEEATAHWTQAADATNLMYYHLCKEILCYLFGDLVGAKRHGDEAEALTASNAGLITYAEHWFFRGLCLIALLGEAKAEEREARIAAIQGKITDMRRWAGHCSANFEHRALLLEAELLAAEGGDLAKITELYDSSAELARANGFLLHAGLACERAGLRCLSLGRSRFGRSYLSDAHYLYSRLGAQAKVEAMESEHGHLRLEVVRSPSQLSETLGLSESTTSSSRSRLESLDILSILKSSQALSGEIVLERLLESLMKIVIENAGAEHGMLLRRRGGRLHVEAEATADGTILTFEDRLPAEEAPNLPLTVIAYTERTGRSVVLSDAAEEVRFRQDPYIVRARPKSLLCMPLIHQGKNTAVLYLENNLVAGSFTEERLGPLNLLSSQLAISIENAALYSTLERRVQERTGELHQKNHELGEALATLRRMQEQIIVQEKLSSLGTLTAGIAHEIRNPLNFVNNFGESLEGLVGELRGQVRGARGQGADPELLDGLLDEIEQAVQMIQKHGKKAEQIIHGMLMHSRGSSTETELCSIHSLLDESVLLTQGLGADIAFVKDYDPSLLPIRVNAQEIARVFLNLISNACYEAQAKRAKSGSDFRPEVRFTTKDFADRVEIRVRDNGDGVPAALRAKIFTPFMTTKPPGKGVGLGLSIGYDIIVKRYGGELRFETEEGRYAEFIVVLPRRAEDHR